MNIQRRVTETAIRVLARASVRRERNAYYYRPPEAAMRHDWKRAVDPMRKQLDPWG